MLKLCGVPKVKVFFLVLVYVINFDLFDFLAAILEKGLLNKRSNLVTMAFSLAGNRNEVARRVLPQSDVCIYCFRTTLI